MVSRDYWSPILDAVLLSVFKLHQKTRKGMPQVIPEAR